MTKRRLSVLLGPVAIGVVVLALALGVSGTRSSVPVQSGVAAGAAGRQSATSACSQFTQLVAGLRAGSVRQAAVDTRVRAIVSAADDAASNSDQWGQLASDAHTVLTDLQANDPAANQAAATLAQDCQQVPSAATTKT